MDYRIPLAQKCGHAISRAARFAPWEACDRAGRKLFDAFNKTSKGVARDSPSLWPRCAVLTRGLSELRDLYRFLHFFQLVAGPLHTLDGWVYEGCGGLHLLRDRYVRTLECGGCLRAS